MSREVFLQKVGRNPEYQNNFTNNQRLVKEKKATKKNIRLFAA